MANVINLIGHCIRYTLLVPYCALVLGAVFIHSIDSTGCWKHASDLFP